jgi:hypothetical protein
MIFPRKTAVHSDLCCLTIYEVSGILFCFLDYTLKNIWTFPIKYPQNWILRNKWGFLYKKGHKLV